jgi:hypothetical protein
MKIIGLVGYKESGKSLAASAIPDWERRSFALPLRKMLLALGVESQYLYERKEEIVPFLGVTGRHLLQSIGSDWGRNMINPNIWVNAALATMVEGGKYVVDDGRFLNEEKALREKGAVIIRINRPGRCGDNHESEQYIKKIKADLEFINDGPEADLKAFIVKAAGAYENGVNLKEIFPKEYAQALETEANI